MKLKWLVLFWAMISMSLPAQQATKPTQAAPAAAPVLTNSPGATSVTNAPASVSKSGKKKVAPGAAARKKDPSAELRTVPLVAGPAVVDATHVNVRGQAKLKSEVVARLNKGQTVTVLEEIVKNNSAPDEPSAWARILLPTNAHVWVHTSFLDTNHNTVLPKKLNVRSGPGENFSILGQLVPRETVQDLGVKGLWMEIEPPTNAYAFVAAQFLKQHAPGSAPTTPTEPAAEPTAVTEPPTVAAAPTEPPATASVTNEPVATNTLAVTNAPGVTNELAMASTNADVTTPPVEEPPPKRVVQREGVVRGTASIQAPTSFGLYNIQNGRLMNYLYTTSPYLDLRRYKGLHIIVTGEEGLEERWGNTPVITIQRIQTLDE